MFKSTILSILILALIINAGKSDSRSYQLQPIPVVNGLQYVPVYTGMPALLIPKQIDVTNIDEFQEPIQHNININRKKPMPLYMMKRPLYYNIGRKKIGYQKLSAVSIEPSIDISEQLFPSTTPSPISTYGPAKVLDHSHMYIRPKVHPYYHHPKDYRIYTHMHKGHAHNHIIPIHKSQYHSTIKPIYPFIKSGTSIYQYDNKKPEIFSTNHIRFPDGELKKTLLNAYKSHQEEILSSLRGTHSDLTQAFVKEPGTINNYDASIPVKIPTKKPNQFEVKEILRNADVHFIDGSIDGSYSQQQQQQQQQQSQSGYYHQNDPSKIVYGQLMKENGLNNNQIDYYDYYGQSTNREEPIYSESVKIPIAVIKGSHSVKNQNSFPVQSQSNPSTLDNANQKIFTQSGTNSDWIPMSPGTSTSAPEVNQNYFSNLLNSQKKENQSPRIITSNRNIGDIISGKIPQEYIPFQNGGIRTGSDVITGKIQFNQESEMDRRKGSVLDENRGSSLDTSNHVVSSMIKFS